MAGSTVGLVYAPFHAAAYLATQSDAPVLLWATAFRNALPWAFDFAGTHGVYVTYGRIMPFVMAGLLVGLWGLHALHRGRGGPLERRTFGPLFAVHSILAASIVVEYYTPLLDEAFMVGGPALLLTLIGYVAYGVATIKAKVVPKRIGWFLVGGALAVPPLVGLLGHIPIALSGIYRAWIQTGVLMARAPTSPTVIGGPAAAL